MSKIEENKVLQRKWYDKYLPFVARSPQMQLEWLVSVFRKQSLSFQEITPYVKIFLADEDDEKRTLLIKLISKLDKQLVDKIVTAADIYDTPELFSLISRPTVLQAVIALRKAPPPYEKNPQAVLDKLYWELHNHSELFLIKARDELLASGNVPEHFEKQFKRFREIVEDEKILSALYPKARTS
jgi:hypothetical protein